MQTAENPENSKNLIDSLIATVEAAEEKSNPIDADDEDYAYNDRYPDPKSTQGVYGGGSW